MGAGCPGKLRDAAGPPGGSKGVGGASPECPSAGAQTLSSCTVSPACFSEAQRQIIEKTQSRQLRVNLEPRGNTFIISTVGMYYHLLFKGEGN